MNTDGSCSSGLDLRLRLRLLGGKIMMQTGAMGLNGRLRYIKECRRVFCQATDIMLGVARFHHYPTRIGSYHVEGR